MSQKKETLPIAAMHRELEDITDRFLSGFESGPRGIWKFPGEAANQSCGHRPTPQPQPSWIPAASGTSAAAHRNAGFFTH